MAIKDQNMIGILQVKYGFILLVYSFKNGTQYLIVIELYKEAISLHSTSFLISFFFLTQDLTLVIEIVRSEWQE